MYIIFGLSAALLASISTILMKKSLAKENENLITFIKTATILFLTIFLIKDFRIEKKEIIILILSGITTSISWIYYYKAMKLTSIKNVVAIDKASTVLTMVLASLFLKEKLNILSIILVSVGIYIMIDKKGGKYVKFGIISVIFVSLTAILSKIGIKETQSIMATFVRITTIFFITLILSRKDIHIPKKRTLFFTMLSATATCLSWICFYQGIKLADVSIIMPLEKLNILFTTLLSRERITVKEGIGLTFIVAGTLYLLS